MPEFLQLDVDDATLRAAIDEANPPALLAALVHLAGEAVLRDDLRPEGGHLREPEGGFSQSQLRELRPKPYPSLAALQKMQTIMAAHDPRISDVQLAKLIDDGFVRTLDESGAITRLYDTYGVDLTT